MAKTEIKQLNVFYSETENILFYIPDYYLDCESNVEKFCKALDTEASFLSNYVSNMKSDINSMYIESSSRYKGMRVFYIQNVNHFNITEGIFHIGDFWTMLKWIRN